LIYELFQEMQIGLAGPVRVISVTHCGELGWMLYIPNEVAQNVYEQLVEAGTLHGLRHCGYYGWNWNGLFPYYNGNAYFPFYSPSAFAH
jgi:glycine cleavage system aminomethyltransferase T